MPYQFYALGRRVTHERVRTRVGLGSCPTRNTAAASGVVGVSGVSRASLSGRVLSLYLAVDVGDVVPGVACRIREKEKRKSRDRGRGNVLDTNTNKNESLSRALFRGVCSKEPLFSLSRVSKTGDCERAVAVSEPDGKTAAGLFETHFCVVAFSSILETRGGRVR